MPVRSSLLHAYRAAVAFVSDLTRQATSTRNMFSTSVCSATRASPFTVRPTAAVAQRAHVAPMAFFGGLALGGGAATKRETSKRELLEAIKPLKRGLAASDEDKARIDSLARQLERANPTKKPLASDLVSGQWELLYTTSESILGSNKPALLRPSGPIYQIIDAGSLRARNQETAPLFNSVQAELIPQSASKVKVQFKQFKLLGLIPITAPPSATGELDITYLDEELRISRGNRGNLFVLKMKDRKVKP